MGVDQRSSWVKNSVTMYTDSAEQQSSVPIPPQGYIQDLAFPADNVVYDGIQLKETDLFPTTDNDTPSMAQTIAGNVGKSIVLTLPLQFGATTKEYRFEFRIVSVKQILWSDYHPPKRNPPPPPKRTSAQVADQVTTAFIVVGILGFAAFMISLKKSPVVE